MLGPLLASALEAAPAAAAAAAPAAATAPDAAPETAPPRGEVLVALDLLGGTSSWSGDPVGYGGLTLGLRLFRVVTPFVQGRLGYGRVDQRLLTLLVAGVEVGGYVQDRFFPRGFVAFAHQHEESMASVAEEPGGALFGVGPGIRHRAGVQVGVGFDIVMHRTKAYELTLGPEVTNLFMTYSSGPTWYGMVGLVGSGHFRFF